MKRNNSKKQKQKKQKQNNKNKKKIGKTFKNLIEKPIPANK